MGNFGTVFHNPNQAQMLPPHSMQDQQFHTIGAMNGFGRNCVGRVSAFEDMVEPGQMRSSAVGAVVPPDAMWNAGAVLLPNAVHNISVDHANRSYAKLNAVGNDSVVNHLPGDLRTSMQVNGVGGAGFQGRGGMIDNGSLNYEYGRHVFRTQASQMNSVGGSISGLKGLDHKTTHSEQLRAYQESSF